MKKLKRISVSNSLTNEELKELKGGQDVLNKNSFFSCYCDYKNESLITNENSVNGCSCKCTY